MLLQWVQHPLFEPTTSHLTTSTWVSTSHPFHECSFSGNSGTVCLHQKGFLYQTGLGLLQLYKSSNPFASKPQAPLVYPRRWWKLQQPSLLGKIYPKKDLVKDTKVYSGAAEVGFWWNKPFWKSHDLNIQGLSLNNLIVWNKAIDLSATGKRVLE